MKKSSTPRKKRSYTFEFRLKCVRLCLEENYPRAFVAEQSDVSVKTLSYQGYLKKYLRCVRGVDDNVKRVVEYLKKEGLYDNTVIMYTGDQGYYLGEHDFADKRWGYEEAMRMPFIVRYPKTIKAGKRSEAIVENVDYAPTMLAFAGVETPAVMQGKSFKEIIETGVEPKTWKKAAYYHYQIHMHHHFNPGHIAIRTKRHKLILFYGAENNETVPNTPPAWELYDLEKDSTEDNNVYDNPEYAGVVAELKDQLKELRSEYKVDGAEFPCNKIIEEYWDYNDEARAKAEQIAKDVLVKFQTKGREWHGHVKKAKKKK
jgi:arylsulfatase A-like enzyme